MILRIDDLKSLSAIILPAVESADLSSLPETLELIAEKGVLHFNVTNKEYFLNVNLPIDESESFHATVNATLFLKLVSSTTTETVQFSVEDNCLLIKGNGLYRLPLIFEDDKIFELPKIVITNVTSEAEVDGNIFNSILVYNTRQLSTGILSRPVQKMYYVDNKGALTFTSGACVNAFDLPFDTKLLFNQRLVKLFKLFKDTKVKFTVGKDAVNDSMYQLKVKFEAKNIVLTSILSCDDELINSVPVSAIRTRAYNNYKYTVVLNSHVLADTLNRIKLFVSATKSMIPYIKLTFNKEEVIISDIELKNKETIRYSNEIQDLEESNYVTMIDLTELQAVLDTCTESTISISFGDSQAIVINRAKIKNIIPEIKVD